MNNKNTYNAIVKQVDGCWIGWVEEIPGVNCQEFTKQELLKTLKITLREILELNRTEAHREAGSEFEEFLISYEAA